MATDLTDLQISCSALSGLPASGLTVTPGSGTLTVGLTAPSLPAGWTITQGNAAAIRNEDPHSGTNYNVAYGFDASSPYSIALTGLTASEEYIVGGWFTFLRDDGKTAYGVSVQTTGTPT